MGKIHIHTFAFLSDPHLTVLWSSDILEPYLIMFMVGVSSLLWRGGIYFRIISHDGIAMVGVLQCVGYIPYTIYRVFFSYASSSTLYPGQ